MEIANFNMEALGLTIELEVNWNDKSGGIGAVLCR
jgi:hypothetical protein